MQLMHCESDDSFLYLPTEHALHGTSAETPMNSKPGAHVQESLNGMKLVLQKQPAALVAPGLDVLYRAHASHKPIEYSDLYLPSGHALHGAFGDVESNS